MAGPKVSARLLEKQRRMREILRILKREYPEAHCALIHRNPFELLVATMLSAQCTDERVNLVTPGLFARYPDARSMAAAPLAELEKIVKSTGFYKNKALALKTTAKLLVERHGGEVPADQDALVALRGVGRKTANVVLGNCFGIPGIVVDTHVGRLCRRMGFTRETDPVKVEHQMMEIIDREDWTLSNHLLIDHGRNLCSARRPMCEECPVTRLCPKAGVGAG